MYFVQFFIFLYYDIMLISLKLKGERHMEKNKRPIMETFSWGVCLLHCGSTTVAFLQRPQSTSPSCSESGQFLNTSHPSRSCPLGLLLSSLPCLSLALCPDVHFSYSPTLPSLMHSPPVSLPPSSLTTPEFISLSLALSLSLPPSVWE